MQVTPNNKLLFKRLCREKNIYTFTDDTNELNTFFNDYLKGTTDTSTNTPIIRKHDYYKWCILDIQNKYLYIYQDNITQKFVDKYQSGNSQVSINSDFLKKFSDNNFNNPQDYDSTDETEIHILFLINSAYPNNFILKPSLFALSMSFLSISFMPSTLIV